MSMTFAGIIIVLLALFALVALVAGVVILVVLLTRKKKATSEKPAQDSPTT